MPETVLISGASGFIASHTVAALLAAGYRVIGTVRNPKNKAQTSHLTGLEGAAENLTLVSADLTDPQPFDAHLDGVDYVIHMASPYILTVDDAARDLVAPAVEGTLSMLNACAAAKSVRRVVLTSSMAAITDEPDENHILTEEDWNTKSSLTRNSYHFSKTQAERAAWAFVNDHDVAWDLVVINPFFVIGPSLGAAVNTSNQMFCDVMKGQFPAIMNLSWGFVDVRDVALAHVRAMTAPAAEGRYICAHESRTMRQVLEMMRKFGYGYGKLPKIGFDNAIGNWLGYLGSYFQPKGVGSYLRTHIGRVPRFDNSKILKDLGVEFRPFERTLEDTLQDLERWGHIPARP